MARRINTQKSRNPIPVIIGAGITEQWYFTHLQNLLNLRIRIRPRFFGTENIHELDKKISQVISEGTVAVCVFDADTAEYSETEARKVEALKKKYANKKNVVLCDSLPSIPDFDSLKIPSLQLSEYPFVMKLKIFQGESLHFGHLCGHVYP